MRLCLWPASHVYGSAMFASLLRRVGFRSPSRLLAEGSSILGRRPHAAMPAMFASLLRRVGFRSPSRLLAEGGGIMGRRPHAAMPESIVAPSRVCDVRQSSASSGIS